MPPWLPPIVLLSDFGGDWALYESALYAIFCRDFRDSKLLFQGKRLGLKRHPMLGGKEATFWHLTSAGKVEGNRMPDLRRCERIAWPRAIIEQAHDPVVKVWENQRQGDRRACLWLEEEDYIVILAMREHYVLPWTAYQVCEGHRKRKLRQEWEEFQKQMKARNG